MSAADELAKYLGSVFDLYPGGIPVRYLESDKDAGVEYSIWGGKPDTEVLFVGEFKGHSTEFSGLDGNLLQAAITKGLKAPMESISVLAFGSPVKDSQFLQSLVSSLESQLTPSKVCFLGKDLGSLFNPTLSERGVLMLDKYFSVHSLESVLASQSKKRDFWQDLQRILLKT